MNAVLPFSERDVVRGSVAEDVVHCFGFADVFSDFANDNGELCTVRSASTSVQ